MTYECEKNPENTHKRSNYQVIVILIFIGSHLIVYRKCLSGPVLFSKKLFLPYSLSPKLSGLPQAKGHLSSCMTSVAERREFLVSTG